MGAATAVGAERSAAAWYPTVDILRAFAAAVLWTLLPALAVAVAAACAVGGGDARVARTRSEDVAILPPSPRGLHPGEAMTYAVSVGGIEVAEATLAVGHPGERDGLRAMRVTSTAVATGVVRAVRDVRVRLDTVVDADTGLPLEAAVELVWGDDRESLDVALHDPRVALHSPHTAMAAVRAWDGAPGDRRRLYLVGAELIVRADLTWIGGEVIGTHLGNRAAVRVDGVGQLVDIDLVPRPGPAWRIVRFSVWMSDDADRVPLWVTARAGAATARFELLDDRR